MNTTPIPEVSAMLGHANVNITLTVYTHLIPKMQTDSATKLAAAIFSGEKPVATDGCTLKQPVLFRKLLAWTLQTLTKLAVPQDYPKRAAVKLSSFQLISAKKFKVRRRVDAGEFICHWHS
jgi:hypothetical protein